MRMLFVLIVLSLAAFICSCDSSSDSTSYIEDITIIEGITLVTIPRGSFRMGDIQKYGEFYHRNHVHDVTLTSFQIGKYEITQGQYQSVMESNPSYFKSGDEYPVEKVSWYDAVKFCNRLSDAAGFDRCYDESSWCCDFSKSGFRLPTEAEWEYACRSGTESRYFTGNNLSFDGMTSTDLDKAGWYSANSGSKTHPVGQKEPNLWGLYDMYGNVNELCNDYWYWDNYSKASVTNPIGPLSGSKRVKRGGSWFNNAVNCRSAGHYGHDPSQANSSHGFRVVRRP